MARLSISNAARVTGVSRMLLYRYIKAGKLSRTSDGTIDTTELLRVGLVLQTSDVTPPVTVLHNVTQYPVPPVTSPVTPDVTPVGTALERLVEVLQRELDAARPREQTHREELTWLRHHFDQVQQRYGRLLDAPRAMAPASPAPAPGTRPDAPVSQHGSAPEIHPGAGPHGAMRRCIVGLLREHPEGLSPSEMRHHLKVDRPLAHTLLAMRRDEPAPSAKGALVKRGRSTLPALGTLGTFGACHVPGPLQTDGLPLYSQAQSMASAMGPSPPRS